MDALKLSDVSALGDPFELFAAWLDDASSTEVNDPNAMALATVDQNGLPDLRMVLLKGADALGFVFFTNTASAKGTELAGNPRAALLFHWKSLRRQVRVRGDVEPVAASEADGYFASRSRESRIGAWASQQSRPLASRQVFEKAVEQVSAAYPGDHVPRPPHWSGYRIVPSVMEFWCDRPHRLHERVVFTRDYRTATWTKTLLYP